MKQHTVTTLTWHIVAVILLLPFATTIAWAQETSSGSQTPKANQVQLSGRNQGGATASVQQSGTGSTSSSVNTISSTVQVQGNYAGSINARWRAAASSI